MKRLLRILGRVTVMLLIAAVLTEVAFRIYGRLNPTFIFYSGSYNRLRATPLSYHYDFRVNSRGFKDVEFNSAKRAGTFRILGLGDSFAYGIVPYEHNYYTVLEKGLRRAGHEVELINMGIGGVGPKDYLSLLVKEGLELDPDMVIVSFFIGNDFSDPTVDKTAMPLHSYSYLATFVKYVVDVRRKFKGQPMLARPHALETYHDDRPTFEDAYFLDLEVGRSEIFREASTVFDSQFQEAVGYLKQIKAMCDARRIALIVVMIPDEVQVNPALQAEVMRVKALTAQPDHFDFALPNRRLRARLLEDGIRYVELLDEFVAAGRGAILYKPKDTHWNIAGNRLAAQIIQREAFGKAGQAVTAAAVDGASAPAPRAAPAAATHEGFHEETDCQVTRGWAWDRRHPDEPVQVGLYDGEALIATVRANRFRKDLLDAGKGNGAHAFEYALPPAFRDGAPHEIHARIAGTRVALRNTPRQIRCPRQ